MKGAVEGTAGWLSIPRAGGGKRRRLAVAVAVLVALLGGLLGSHPAAAQDSGTGSGICGRTEAVRDAILDKLSQVSDCADVTDSDLSGITGTMHVSDDSPLTLQDGDFAGMSGLDVLYLSGNRLASLPDGALSGLSTLRELNLYSNSLTTLSNDVFDGLTNLEKLQLSHNNLTSLPADIFDDLPFLSRLNLDNNSLSALPDGIFDGHSALLELQLTNNPGAPFTLTAELQLTDDGDVVVTVAEGTPFDMTVALSADGGTLSTTPVTLSAGSTTSSSVTVTASGTDDVVVSVDSADLAIDNRHSFAGIQAGAGDDLTISGTAQASSDCTESLGTLSAGDTTRSGNTSDTCTRYLPHGYSYVVDNDSGSAKAFTFTLSSAATVTVSLDHDTTYDAADEPVLELISGHHDHTTAVGTLLRRAVDTNDQSVPISVGVALPAGDYTAQIANRDWQRGGAFSYSLTINVAEATTGNNILVLSGTTKNTYREDYTSAVDDYAVLTDGSDGDVVEWTLSGDDSGDFSISSSGVLTFASQPDYESPADNDTDNDYEVTVTATRGTASGNLDVTITVTDFDETPDGDSFGGV